MRPERRILLGILTVVGLLIVGFLALTCLYVVDEREMAVVLQFGNPVQERTEPGLYMKMPFIQEVRKLPAPGNSGATMPAKLPDLPTKDDKKIEVVPWAIWRISDPTVFVQRLRNTENAEQRVAQFVRGAIRDVVTRYELAELVRSSNREMHTSADLARGLSPKTVEEIVPEEELEVQAPSNEPSDIEFGRQKILQEIKQEVQQRLASGVQGGGVIRGIELVDVGISQIEFVESVRTSTFDRWIAEREAISARNTNEGERLKQAILNRTLAEVEEIEGQGQRQASELRGTADAEIIRQYALAIEEVGDFYTFVRTLEAYRSAIGPGTRLILTTDSDFMSLLKQPGKSESPPLPTGSVETTSVPEE